MLSRTVWWRVLTWAMRGGEPIAPLYLRTSTGRLYRVHTVKRCRPGSQARYVFGCCRIDLAELPPDTLVIDWNWAPRSARKIMTR